MPELLTRVESHLLGLDWKILNPGDGKDRGRDRILLAESAGGGACFRLLVHDLDAAGPLVFYQRPAKTIARPEPLAGIIPVALASSDLPFRSQTFVLKNGPKTFQYADECLGAGSRRDLLPGIALAAGRLRRRFLRDYLEKLAAASRQGGDLFYLNLLVTEAPLLTLHPDEAASALASGDPAAMAWEAGCVPLFLPPHRLGRLAAMPPVPESSRSGNLLSARGPSLAFRLRYLAGQLPGIYWVVAADHLEESLRFILSYGRRWHSDHAFNEV